MSITDIAVIIILIAMIVFTILKIRCGESMSEEYADALLNELKWKEHTEYHGTSERCVMEADDVFDEIMAAVNYELEKPYYKKLDSMWDDWNNNKTGKYAKINTMQEMLDIICDCLEIEYPGLIELEKKYFGLSLKSDENEDESQ